MGSSTKESSGILQLDGNFEDWRFRFQFNLDAAHFLKKTVPNEADLRKSNVLGRFQAQRGQQCRTALKRVVRYCASTDGIRGYRLDYRHHDIWIECCLVNQEADNDDHVVEPCRICGIKCCSASEAVSGTFPVIFDENDIQPVTIVGHNRGCIGMIKNAESKTGSFIASETLLNLGSCWLNQL